MMLPCPYASIEQTSRHAARVALALASDLLWVPRLGSKSGVLNPRRSTGFCVRPMSNPGGVNENMKSIP
jgi:hypothetical protein